MTVVPLVPRVKLLKLEEVEALTNCKKSKIYSMMREGTFPRSKKFGRNAMWSEASINQWVADQLTEGDNQGREGSGDAS